MAEIKILLIFSSKKLFCILFSVYPAIPTINEDFNDYEHSFLHMEDSASMQWDFVSQHIVEKTTALLAQNTRFSSG